jgi:hypothetical protein
MQLDFIKNVQALVMDGEGMAWQFRNGQDQQAVEEKITGEILRKYQGNIVADTRYRGNGAYGKLEPQQRAAIDMYLMDNFLIYGE